jgi:hypothetical protein
MYVYITFFEVSDWTSSQLQEHTILIHWPTTSRPLKGHHPTQFLLVKNGLFAWHHQSLSLLVKNGLFTPPVIPNGPYKITLLPHFLLACTVAALSYTLCFYQCPLLNTIHFTLKMETAWPSWTLVSNYIITQCQNLEDHNLNLHCCKIIAGDHIRQTRTKIKFTWQLLM